MELLPAFAGRVELVVAAGVALVGAGGKRVPSSVTGCVATGGGMVGSVAAEVVEEVSPEHAAAAANSGSRTARRRDGMM